jgi:ribosome biogenesis protein SSF1/2
VLLISYQSESNLISVRHYTISVRPHGVSRRVRKLLNVGATSKSTSGKSKVDLGSAEDIADYLLRRSRADSASAGSDITEGSAGMTNYDSASETDASEAESDSNAVELPDDYVGRGNKKGSRKAVRLVEMGPRMELRLVKIVEGLVGSKKGEGETVFHEFGTYRLHRCESCTSTNEQCLSRTLLPIVHKTKKDAAAQQAEKVAQRKARDLRRKQQEANVARKQAAADAKKNKGKKAATAEDEEDDDEDDDKVIVDDDEVEVEGFSSSDDDEFEYEDRYAKGGERDDGEDWNDEVDAGDVSEDEDEKAAAAAAEEESSEDEAPPAKKPQRKKGKSKA